MRELFQSTLLQEERQQRTRKTESEENISIHAPTRGATLKIVQRAIRICFSIHAPTRGATRLMNPEPLRTLISIHAPTRGATSWWYNFKTKRFNISIHAPTRGATNILGFYWSISGNFNPRSYKRSDRFQSKKKKSI